VNSSDYRNHTLMSHSQQNYSNFSPFSLYIGLGVA